MSKANRIDEILKVIKADNKEKSSVDVNLTNNIESIIKKLNRKEQIKINKRIKSLNLSQEEYVEKLIKTDLKNKIL